MFSGKVLCVMLVAERFFVPVSHYSVLLFGISKYLVFVSLHMLSL